MLYRNRLCLFHLVGFVFGNECHLWLAGVLIGIRYI
jgi:hypothetical protein